jgi:hypothetical protein
MGPPTASPGASDGPIPSRGVPAFPRGK